MGVRKTDTVLKLQKIQEGISDEIKLMIYQERKSSVITSLKQSLKAVEGYHILPTMSSYNKTYLLRAAFKFEGHSHRQLRERKGFNSLMKELNTIKLQIMEWKDGTK